MTLKGRPYWREHTYGVGEIAFIVQRKTNSVNCLHRIGALFHNRVLLHNGIAVGNVVNDGNPCSAITLLFRVQYRLRNKIGYLTMSVIRILKIKSI